LNQRRRWLTLIVSRFEALDRRLWRIKTAADGANFLMF